MTMTTRLHTFFHGKHVGTDVFGNRYFEAKRMVKGERRRRSVLYKGMAEPSKVPAEWHGWLHYTTDKLPEANSQKKYSWEKSHLPNLTGTQGAYLPKGSLLQSGEHASTVADIKTWKP